MIEILVLSDRNGHIRDITIKGHAGQAEAGRDIVCAAYSAIAQYVANTLVNIYKSKRVEIELEEGYFHLFVKDIKLDEVEKTIIKGLIAAAEGIALQYRPYVRFRKEVRVKW